MKIGLDGFALPGGRRTALQTLAFVHEHGLDGAFFASPLALSPTLDCGELGAVRTRADELGLYLELGVGLVNPKHFAQGGPVLALGDGDYRRGLERPAAYEAVPQEQQAMARLQATVGHPRGVLRAHDLAGQARLAKDIRAVKRTVASADVGPITE